MSLPVTVPVPALIEASVILRGDTLTLSNSRLSSCSTRRTAWHERRTGLGTSTVGLLCPAFWRDGRSTHFAGVPPSCRGLNFFPSTRRIRRLLDRPRRRDHLAALRGGT